MLETISTDYSSLDTISYKIIVFVNFGLVGGLRLLIGMPTEIGTHGYKPTYLTSSLSGVDHIWRQLITDIG